jgi:hypothetical protein
MARFVQRVSRWAPRAEVRSEKTVKLGAQLAVLSGVLALSGCGDPMADKQANHPASGGTVVDVTPQSQVSPKYHVVYDFARHTVAFVQVDLEERGSRIRVLNTANYLSAEKGGFRPPEKAHQP